jgi:hypothetical protein
MKKFLLIFVIAACALPAWAQIRNSVNASLDSWTVDESESDEKAQVNNVVIQRVGNTMQYSVQYKNGTQVHYKFDRITKLMHRETKNQPVYTTQVEFSESGATSVISFTGEDGAKNILTFRRK